MHLESDLGHCRRNKDRTAPKNNPLNFRNLHLLFMMQRLSCSPSHATIITICVINLQTLAKSIAAPEDITASFQIFPRKLLQMKIITISHCNKRRSWRLHLKPPHKKNASPVVHNSSTFLSIICRKKAFVPRVLHLLVQFFYEILVVTFAYPF